MGLRMVKSRAESVGLGLALGLLGAMLPAIEALAALCPAQLTTR